jgi:hypothetical protein
MMPRPNATTPTAIPLVSSKPSHSRNVLRKRAIPRKAPKSNDLPSLQLLTTISSTPLYYQ